MYVYVIAEAGVNHNGDPAMAFALVDAAHMAGADAVKFQMFDSARLVTGTAAKADYQIRNDAAETTQRAMLRRLELEVGMFLALRDRAAERGLDFLVTPFDVGSLRILVERLGATRIKLSSGEVTNAQLLLETARYGVDILLSTGMCTLDEVRDALGVLAHGLLTAEGASGVRPPHRAAFAEAFASEAGRMALRRHVRLLHCTSEYPAPFEDVNLKAMDTLAETFGLPVGLSDHSEGIWIPIAAAARGTTLIEKHFTLSRDLPGPDHRASIEPDQLAEMVTALRATSRALGDGLKRPGPSERANIPIVRRGLYALRPIARGESFSTDNLIAKRPEAHRNALDFWDLIGTAAGRDYAADEPIEDR